MHGHVSSKRGQLEEQGGSTGVDEDGKGVSIATRLPEDYSPCSDAKNTTESM